MEQLSEGSHTGKSGTVLEPQPSPGVSGSLLAIILPFISAAAAESQVNINEIHYAPDIKTEAVEFIELHNSGVQSVALSGWHLSGGVDYHFSPGTVIASGGYLVIAQDPAALSAKYGVSSIGPWTGRLANDQDEIKLDNSLGQEIDEVEYRIGFPWPTVGDAPGPSIELIHPSFDNDLGGNWRSSRSAPTPGRINSVYASNAPPQLRQVDHAPNQPVSGDVVVITAKVTDPEGIGTVMLQLQSVDPGNYIALTDADYATGWVSIAMHDDGIDGDALSGDSVYSVTVPGDLQAHRRLVRYRIYATDGAGSAVTVPYADDPQPNFAYFCYDGIPAWQGAVQPGTTPTLNFDTNVMRRLPAVHLISRNSDIETATWFERYMGDLYKWSGTLVYDGKVYDHIRYRARGGSWRYAMVKNMWKFDFNRGHDFQMRDDFGKKYSTTWTKLNLGACIQQGNYWHRGEQGMFESVGSRLFNLAGADCFKTTFLQLRIIDDAEEAATTQYEGDFWGLYLAMEQQDGRFLDEHDLPDGNLYKMEFGTGELNNLGPLGPSDKSDLDYILYNHTAASDAWWQANWNLEKYYSYQTIVQAIHHYDINNNKNYFYYHNPETGRWEVIPWDLDLTWADNMYNPSWGGLNTLAYRILDAGAFANNLTLPGSTRTAFRTAFRNRIREIRDLLFNEDQAGLLIDEQARLLRDPGGGLSFLDADRAMWDHNPKMDDGTYTPSLDKAVTGRYYQWPLELSVTRDFEGCVQLMKNYVRARGTILDTLAADADVPATPSINYAGEAGYPLNGLAFHCSSFSDPQGSGTFAAMAWRAGEVLDTNAPAHDPTGRQPYEITAIWESGELTTFSNMVTIPVNALKAGHAYRVRVRMKDNTGRWSHWSNPIQFVATEATTADALAGFLRISELMVSPVAGSDYEFVELHNTSTNQVLDLGGAAFTAGIDFGFPAGTLMNPGQYLLVIGTTNTADFRTYYGLPAGTPMAGPYEGSLSIGGEEIRLKTAPGGSAIVSFEYSDNRFWPLAAAGAGHSLVPMTTEGQATGALDYPGNWRASTWVGGSPGGADPVLPTELILSEITAHSDDDSNDWIELCNVSSYPVSLDNCYLSDDPQDPRKWACPSVMIPAGGRLVFTEVGDFHNPISEGFGLDKAGDQVLLSYLPGLGLELVLDAVGFKGQENGRSLSRIGDYWYSTAPSPGVANNIPLNGLRIAEFMFHPAPLGTNDNTRDEFIEIHNPTAADVTMQSVGEAWRIDGGVEYTFPENTHVPAGSSLIIVGFDPADTAASNAFFAAYGITNAVRMYGPWDGTLGNRSERVALERPQAPDLLGDDYSWVVEDETVYGNQHPWPVIAGKGQSLLRLQFNQSGLDPANWTAATPSPGRPFADRDGDGMSDQDEFICGTDPNDSNSVFRVEGFDGSGFSWLSVPDRTYSVYWTHDLGVPFQPFATNLAYPQSNLTDSVHATNPIGFYRLKVDY